MALRIRNKKAQTVAAAAEVTLRVVRDTTSAFPPLQSIVAAVVMVWEMSKKAKSNKKDCKQLAHRAAEITHDIWRQTKDYGDRLPVEVQHSIRQIELIFRDIIAFMGGLEKQGFVLRYSHQDDNTRQLERFNKLLDDAILHFGVNLQLSVYRLHTETSERFLEMDDVHRERHNEVVGMSQMSMLEREQLLTKIEAKVIAYTNDIKWGKISISFFF